ERERVVFRRLAVFSGGFTLEAAEAICAGGYPAVGGDPVALQSEDVLDLLVRLVDKSLVYLDQGAGRYRLLETIRYYCREKLEEAQETGTTGLRHVERYLQFVEAGAGHMGGPQERDWLDTLECEHDNCRAALARAIGEGWADEAARLALALWPFWHIRTYL